MSLPAARSMTCKERKQFREAGIDPSFQKGDFDVFELNEKIVDFVKAMYGLGGEEIEDIPYADLVALADKTYRITYGMEKDVKNSEASGGGTPTDAQNTAAPA